MSARTIFFRYIAPCISAVAILSGIRFVDTTFFPPVTIFDVKTITVEVDSVHLIGRMYKPEYRASCELQSVVALVNNYQFEVLYQKNDGRTTTRPYGWSDFDLAVPGVGIRDVTLTSRHSCYGSIGWDHSTTNAVIQVKAEP